MVEDLLDVSRIVIGQFVLEKGRVDIASVVNAAPIANAGPDQNVVAPVLVTLDGSGSTDANGDTLTYAWTFINVPKDSVASLAGATTATPSFLADLPGTYVVRLVVNDGTVNSAPSLVLVKAK